MSDNLFDMEFRRNPEIGWHVNSEKHVVLHMENKGFCNRLAQKLLNKPKVSTIELDEISSAVWVALDKNNTIITVSEVIHYQFKEKAEPLLERLVKFFQILLANHLVIASISKEK